MILLRIIITLIYAIIALPAAIIIAILLWIRSIPLVWDKRRSLQQKRKQTTEKDIIGDAVKETLAEMEDAMQPQQSMNEDDPVVYYPYKSNRKWD